MPLSTKIIYGSIFIYFTFTQLLLYQKISSNTSDKDVIDLQEYLNDSIKKLTTIAFSSASFLRDIGKSSGDIDWSKLEKDLEKAIGGTDDKKNDLNFNGPEENHFLPLERQPKAPLKISVVINVRNLKTLERSFRSISDALEPTGIVFRVFGLSPTDEEPSFKDGRFLMIPYDKVNFYPKTVASTKEEVEIFNKNLDWIKMMERWKAVCNGAEVFLYLDDETEICPDAGHTLISTYLYLLKHRYSFLSARLSNDFSGIFLQCREIKTMINRVKTHAMKQTPVIPYDVSFRLWWSNYLPYTLIKQITFRYNLFRKINNGGVLDSPDSPKCFEPNGNNFLKDLIFEDSKFFKTFDKFDSVKCHNSMFTPCDQKPYQNELLFIGNDAIKSQSILRNRERNHLMRKLHVQVLKSDEQESCKTICENRKLVCSKESFPFVNNCDVMKHHFKCNSQCFFGNEKYLPIFDGSCRISTQLNFDCETKNPNKGTRLCPCREKDFLDNFSA
eukprot:gene12478-6226_t